MFLIMSAEYITQELRSEFGALPPSFLPLGNRRLFFHQKQLVSSDDEIFITLPESFSVPHYDRDWLVKNNVELLSLPDGLGLGASLVAALNLIDSGVKGPLHVLFGDTLIDPLPEGEDLVAIANVEDNYDWAVVTDSDDQWLIHSNEALLYPAQEVVSGYFRFSAPWQLIRCITKSNWDFYSGLNLYRRSVGLNTVKVRNWLDFGHANTYYHSKSEYTTQRSFNDLMINGEWVEKSGNFSKKIEAEASWFENIPPILKRYTPQYLGRSKKEGKSSYRLEYLHHTALNELFVFSSVPSVVWKKIIDECLRFITTCSSHKPSSESEPVACLSSLFREKTKARLQDFITDNHISTSRRFRFLTSPEAIARKFSVDDLLSISEAHLPKNEIEPTLVHGDFCFSNILYEYRTNRIKVIDPRGLTSNGLPSIYGDYRYDIAKLSHSVLGLYDWIVAGYCKASLDEDVITLNIPIPNSLPQTQKLFVDMVTERFGLTEMELYAMQVQLFLSMLPLHKDNRTRQFSLFANAFRLCSIMEGMDK